MTFAFPSGLAALAALALVWWLHRRQRPSRRVVVSSLTPWLTVAERQAEPHRDTPFSLLLALRLGVAAAIGLSLAAPVFIVEGNKGADGSDPNAGSNDTGSAPQITIAGPTGLLASSAAPLVLVMDTSTSMAAASRWSAALERGEDWIARASGPISIVTFGGATELRTLAARPGQARTVLHELAPGGSESRVGPALALARDLAGDRGRIVVVSDGVLRDSPSAADAAPVVWDRVGPQPDETALDNVALVRASSRSTPTGIVLFAQFASFSRQDVRAPLHVTVDETTYVEDSLVLSAGATAELSWHVPPRARTARISIDLNDALAADNAVELPLQPIPLRVQYVPATRSSDADSSSGSSAESAAGADGATRRAIASLPSVDIDEATAGSYRVDGSVDASVFEGWQPDSLPPGGVLIVNPAGTAPSGAGLSSPANLGSDHPWFDGLDLGGVRVEGWRPDPLPSWASAVLTATEGVLIYAGETATGRVVGFNFDPDAGNLATRPAFPLLVGRALAWAAPYRPQPVVRAGHRVLLPARPVLIDAAVPSVGSVVSRIEAKAAMVVRGLPARLEITETGDASPRRWWSGVLAGDAFESDLHRAPAVPASTPGQGNGLQDRRLGPWLLLLAIGLLAAESLARSGRWPKAKVA